MKDCQLCHRLGFFAWSWWMKYQTQLEPLCVATTQLLPDAFLQTSQRPSCRRKSSIPSINPLAGMLRCASQLPEVYSKTCENKQNDQRSSKMTKHDSIGRHTVHSSGCGTTWQAWEIQMVVAKVLSVAPSTMACGVSEMSRRWRWGDTVISPGQNHELSCQCADTISYYIYSIYIHTLVFMCVWFLQLYIYCTVYKAQRLHACLCLIDRDLFPLSHVHESWFLIPHPQSQARDYFVLKSAGQYLLHITLLSLPVLYQRQPKPPATNHSKRCGILLCVCYELDVGLVGMSIQVATTPPCHTFEGFGNSKRCHL